MNWMNLPEKYRTKQSKTKILPIQYENNPTYKKGSKQGSTKIIKASKQLDYYDSWYEEEIYTNGIQTLPAIIASKFSLLQKKIEKQIQDEKEFIISIGGDHAITIAIVKAHEKNKKDFGYVCLDAHADMWSSWKNSSTNHACVTNKIHKNHKTLLVGVRTMDIDEHLKIKKHDDINIIRDEEFEFKIFQEELQKLPKNVYVSIDVDSFTPKLIKNTGTPEPGGFEWHETISMIEEVCKTKNVIGVDIVEFSPTKNYESEAYILAKLINKIIVLKQIY